MKKYLGKTVLYSINLARFDGMVHYGRVTDFSPSGKYVCISHAWQDVEKVNVLEELPETESAPFGAAGRAPAAPAPAPAAPAPATEVAPASAPAAPASAAPAPATDAAPVAAN